MELEREGLDMTLLMVEEEEVVVVMEAMAVAMAVVAVVVVVVGSRFPDCSSVPAICVLRAAVPPDTTAVAAGLGGAAAVVGGLVLVGASGRARVFQPRPGSGRVRRRSGSEREEGAAAGAQAASS